MKKTKFVALMLATAMTIGCMVGCGQESTQKTETNNTESAVKESTSKVETESKEEQHLFNVNGELPIVNEEVTLKILTKTQPEWTGSVMDLKIWDWLTEKTGIKFEVEAYSEEVMAQKLPLIMASDDLPDIFWNCGLSTGDLLGYAEQGKIIAMDDLIEEYAYYTNQLIEDIDNSWSFFTSLDGHVYALPRCSGTQWGTSMVINEGWLKNVNKEMPTTLEELYDVLKAFKEQDANGNGDPNDEIPFSVPNGTARDFTTPLLEWVGIVQYWPPTGARFDVRDNGEVFLAPVSDEYRYLLEMLHKFYEEELLDNEIFTHTSDEHTAKKNDNRVGVSSSGWTKAIREEYGFDQRYLFLTSAVNDEFFSSTGGRMNPNLFSISATCKYPEVAFLLADYFYSEEASWVSLNGMEGEQYTWASEEDKENYRKTLLTDDNPYYFWASQYQRAEWIQPSTYAPAAEDNAYRMAHSRIHFQHFANFTAEETDQIAIMSTDIGGIIDEHFVQFITGAKELNDSTWKEYTDLIESLGGEELTAMYQTAYDRQFAE